MSTNAMRPAGSTDTALPSAATSRSPSLIAPASQVASLSKSTPASAVTRPPVPRSGWSTPASSRWNVIGPRLDATTSGDSNAVACAAVCVPPPSARAIDQVTGAPSRCEDVTGSLAGRDPVTERRGDVTGSGSLGQAELRRRHRGRGGRRGRGLRRGLGVATVDRASARGQRLDQRSLLTIVQHLRALLCAGAPHPERQD